MDQGWDREGAAAAALHRVVQDFSQQVLTRADMLEGLLLDDLSSLPREVDVLTTAARIGVARLLTERIGHGVSPEAAIAMAASDMTSRTAVDSSGARWAAVEFARVLGYPVANASPPPAQVATQPPAPTPPYQVPGQPAWLPGQPQPAVFPGQPQPATFPGQAQPAAFPGQPQPVAMPPGYGQAWARPTTAARVRPATPGRGLAVGAGVLTGILALLALLGPIGLRFWSGFWLLNPYYYYNYYGNYYYGNASTSQSELLLAAGFAVVSVWTIASWRTGYGLAATIGLALPVAFDALYLLGNDLIGKFMYGYYWLLGSGWLVAMGWLVLGLAAAMIGIAGVARVRQSGRVPRGPLRVILAVLGVSFPLVNFYLASVPHGWYRLSGALFLILLAVPPLLATFLPCRHDARVALWCGWLIFTLAWQVSEMSHYRAIPWDLTWLVWIATLVATIVLAIRRPTADADSQAIASTGALARPGGQ